MSARFKPNDGDWICSDTKCGNVNFSRRTNCNKCGKSKSEGLQYKKGGNEIGKQLAEKSKGLFSADDWQCKTCGNVNWARRSTCNLCNTPKIGKLETRTGYGGGFMERDEVIEYKDRNSDDEEYDEFGRKKKKYRGPLQQSSVVASQPTDDGIDNDENENEEDDDDAGVSKYNLTDEENDSDDDDDGNDISKYVLDEDDDDQSDKEKASASIANQPNARKRSHSSSSSSNSSSSLSHKRAEAESSHSPQHTSHKHTSSGDSRYSQDGCKRKRSP